MTGKRIIIAGVLIIVAMVCLSGCISPQDENTDTSTGSGMVDTSGTIKSGAGTTTNQGSSGGSGPTATASPTPGEAGYLTPVTPFPVGTTPTTGVSGTRLVDISPNATEYMAIYYGNIQFKNNKTAYTYELYRPPLVIEMCFSPNMSSRTIWFESKYGDHDEKTETVTSISPNAWFEVTVRDPVTGQVIAKEGYAKAYSVDTGKALTIRSPGKYLIEFSGNELSAQIQIRVPEEDNPAGSPLRPMSCTF
jgi:hypothetical protein